MSDGSVRPNVDARDILEKAATLVEVDGGDCWSVFGAVAKAATLLGDDNGEDRAAGALHLCVAGCWRGIREQPDAWQSEPWNRLRDLAAMHNDVVNRNAAAALLFKRAAAWRDRTIARLTNKQRRVYDCVVAHSKAHGGAPSGAYIQRTLKLKDNPNQVLRALAHKGLVVRDANARYQLVE